MLKPKANSLILRRKFLDYSFKRLKTTLVVTPKNGWIRSIREVLGMSLSQLAKRAKIDQSTISRLEKSELKFSPSLKTMQKMAEALECDFYYCFIPKTTLNNTMSNQAAQFLKKIKTKTTRTMELEDQYSGKIESEFERTVLIANSDKRIWEE